MNIEGELLDFNKPLTMGILNITDDSFYEGSRYRKRESLIERAGQMLDEGADILDLGAQSTRPGAELISEKQETETLIEAIKAVKDQYPHAIVSADTFRANVARAAKEIGASIINDVGSGILDPEMFDAIAELKVPYVLMHNRDTPKNMGSKAVYEDVVDEVVFELSEKLNELRKKNVADVIIDPGFGFAKTVDHNFEMLNRFKEFRVLGCPLLAGISRKSMVWKSLGTTPNGALNGTTVLNTIALENGASILRVHDVLECTQAIKLVSELNKQTNRSFS